ncbi:MAG TPA: hypothetical protein VF250_00800 [Conexibacter sp.]
MPRRTHPLLLAAALAVGLLLAVGLAACGDSGSGSAETLDTPPLTVGAGATLPSTSTTSPTTTTTSTTADSSGGAADTGAGSGGAVDTGGDTGGGTGADTGGGTAPDTGGGGTTTPTQPANPGGAAPNYQSFCDENQGAC